ncbi:MAG: endolytic transglycosylase MltG [Gammaproteobacteria bacterium]
MRKVFVIVVVVVAGAGLWLWHDVNQFLTSPVSVPKDGINFRVERGSNLTYVSRKLAKRGVLQHPRYLVNYAHWILRDTKISVGQYHIAPGTTPVALLHQLLEGKVIQYSITLVDGWTFAQAFDVVEADPHLEHRLKGLKTDAIMARLGHPGENPEGRFMPDTYHFPEDTTDIAFLQRAYTAMQDYLKQVWPDRDVGIPLKTPYQALILASIVEKETGLASERRTIAGVFTRRLRKHMRLQSDPTVIYGMGKQYKGDIRWRDLRSKNPYNTYEHGGLPPTPIALPSRAAIDAVLHPKPGDALYFVSRGDGSHKFSATLEEHNRAVIKYQLKGRQHHNVTTSGKSEDKRKQE